METPKQTFARLLREARGNRSQAWLARQVGISQRSIASYEDVKDSSFPKPAIMVSLALATKQNPKEWFGLAGYDDSDFPARELGLIVKGPTDPEKILTREDLEFLLKQIELFDQFSVGFALELLSHRKH